jgi:hypothetical protein
LSLPAQASSGAVTNPFAPTEPSSVATWIFQPSVGAGFKVKNVAVDYAFTNLANQDAPLFTHVVSLSLQLKKKEK